VEWLLKCGADPNVAENEGVTGLFMACQNGHLAVVEELLKRKDVVATINKECGEYGTPLVKANQKGHSKIVDLLVANGAK